MLEDIQNIDHVGIFSVLILSEKQEPSACRKFGRP